MITKSVKRLPAENGVSGWEAISKRPFPVRSLEGNVTADWLIIGAGFAGLSAARRLLQLRPHDKIVILDASEVGKGTSGRNSGYHDRRPAQSLRLANIQAAVPTRRGSRWRRTDSR